MPFNTVSLGDRMWLSTCYVHGCSLRLSVQPSCSTWANGTQLTCKRRVELLQKRGINYIMNEVCGLGWAVHCRQLMSVPVNGCSVYMQRVYAPCLCLPLWVNGCSGELAVGISDMLQQSACQRMSDSDVTGRSW